MASSPIGPLTQLLKATGDGDADAAARLLELVYEELRGVAARRLQRSGGPHTLQPTALVHEVWLRLMGHELPRWANRRHFFSAAARAMRDILVERARAATAAKRGGGRLRIDLAQVDLSSTDQAETLLLLDEALRRLEQASPPAAQVVMLRFFAGLTVLETAAALETSSSSVDRLWAWAKAWLQRELERNQR